MKKQHRKLSGHRSHTALSSPVLAFAPIVRAKKIPAETARALGLDKIEGENRLEVRAEGDESHIYLSGSIGKSWWDDSGVTEQEVRDALKSIPAGRKITAHINSEGGSVQDGLGIYNAFRDRAADLTAKVDGYAVSIASVIPLGAGKVVSPKSAIWMIHNAWSWASGNADDMRQQAKMLDEHDSMLAEIYHEHTGKPLDEIRQAMADETWVRGSQAVEFGLADETDPEEKDDAQARYVPIAAQYLARCKNCPAEILNALRMPVASAPTTAAQPAGNQNPNTTDNMNKKIVVALLKKHGIEASESETEEQLQAKLEKIPTAAAPAPAPAPAPDVLGLADLRKQLEIEKRNRVAALVRSKAENKIPNDKLDWWTNLAMADETGTLAQIDALPVAQPGAAGISGSRIEFGSDPEPETNGLPVGSLPSQRLINLREAHKASPEQRRREMVSNWKGLIDEALRADTRRGRVVATAGTPANTYTSTLVTAFLIDACITKLQNRWAPLMAFTRDFSTDPYKPLATGHLKNPTSATASSGSATGKNLTNFEDGDSIVSDVSIGVDQYSRPFNVSNSDLQSGLRMENLVDINLGKFCDILIAVATAPITVANYETTGGNTSLVKAAGNFGFSDLQVLWGQLKKANRRNLILDGEYLAKLINTPTFFQRTGTDGNSWLSAFGWDGVYLNTIWTGADTAVRGFACDPQAIGAIAGLPLAPVGAFNGTLSVATATIPQVEISMSIFNWFNLAQRTMWCSFDAMMGVSVLDTTAGVLIKSS